MKKKWKLYLIQHSHTDIGYTDRQEKIERHHVDYIKSAIDSIDAIESGTKKEWEGFKWTCENFWQVEQFLENCNEEYSQKFKKYVQAGFIDISLTYLNMTELVDNEILDQKFQKGREYAETNELDLNSAMTADINGFSWGYAETLYKNGIVNLFTCVHTHHGMFPLYKKQIPFWWETPKGHKILVWNGDHYHMGNQFMLIPNSYRINKGSATVTTSDQMDIAEQRIFTYLENLEEEDYPFDFIPNMISGIGTDNSPPNPRLMEMIHKWNAKHGEQVEIELITLNEFFLFLRKQAIDIPTYSGDWTDWWADGVGSTPAPTKIYRDAQRKYHLSKKLDPEDKLGKLPFLKEAEYQLMLYAEHTWGYNSSVREPWNTLVNDLDFRKAAYATNANRLISKNLDEVLSNLGEVAHQIDRKQFFKVVNPHHNRVTDYTSIQMKNWEHIDGAYLDNSIEVVDCQTNEVLDSQLTSISRGNQIEFAITLDPKEERMVKLRRGKAPQKKMVVNHAGVEDLAAYPGYEKMVNTHVMETNDYKITFNHSSGIESFVHKHSGEELIHPDALYAPFAGVYEKTPIQTDPSTERRVMGLNRKGRLSERHEASLKNMKVIEDGKLFTSIKMDFALAGTEMYNVVLKVYKDMPKIGVNVRIQKQNEWAPENLYIPLPFSLGEASELFVEKTGNVFRPAIDQLPGTNTEFYLLQNGLAFKDEEQALLVAIKDTPLITLGTLDHHEIELCNENTHKKNKDLVYSWVMNNFWETNFKVDLSGFYEFDYQLYFVSEKQSAEQLLEKCQELNEGLVTFPVNPE
ncbi:glycosyl hydrolase [Lederbergia galactosidilytica]|uniref:Glycosyl hydrolase n=1 Tax=Lederbergia galactosidilytica TaxID=217031 RepID=A0A177ZHZ8_9BACI|nr:glycosyl hydrolase [Lederbergia galactosidilytica]KRG15803.1 glycosyl hydrolase [Virgibacillus soli]MBP1915489.1 hypothetical protein [Lederbergia galactosidilytica]OAK67591.1 glycosyl hydrolase [Lederbergia galactosidilytica]